MVEWGRLLSGYWGEILSRRFESCPPRHKNRHADDWRVFVCLSARPPRQAEETREKLATASQVRILPQVPATIDTPITGAFLFACQHVRNGKRLRPHRRFEVLPSGPRHKKGRADDWRVFVCFPARPPREMLATQSQVRVLPSESPPQKRTRQITGRAVCLSLYQVLVLRMASEVDLYEFARRDD